MPGQDVKAAVGYGVQVNQRDQHQQGAEQGVQEKLESGVDLVWAAPDADDQVHRDQGGLKKDVEQDAVQSTEHANHQTRQNQESGHVLVHFAGDDLPARNDHDHVDERGQQHKPQRNAVQPQVVVHIEALNPRSFFDKLHGRSAELKARIQRQRDQETGDRADERKPAHSAGLAVMTEGQQDNAESNRRPDGKA